MTAPVLVNPYEMLGVSRQATPLEIHRAWRELIKQTHPDHALSEPERLQLEELTRELNAAYHAIKDPTRRADVDAELRHGADTQRTTTTGWSKEHNGDVNQRRDPKAAKTADTGGWSNVPPPPGWPPNQRPDPKAAKTPYTGGWSKVPPPPGWHANQRSDPKAAKTPYTGGWSKVPPQPGWRSDRIAAPEARYGIPHQHQFRADLFSARGLLRFLTHDRVGQWLVSLTWLAVLTWMVTPAFKLDGATYLSFALVGLGLQAVFAHRLEHTPLHDLLRLSRAIVVGLFHFISEIASASSSKSPPPSLGGRGLGIDPRYEDF